MKRYLILFVLIVFATVSCAGWTKPDFRQDQFDKDQKECLQTADSPFARAFEECLLQKGYNYEGFPPEKFTVITFTEKNKELETLFKIIETIFDVLLGFGALGW